MNSEKGRTRKGSHKRIGEKNQLAAPSHPICCYDLGGRLWEFCSKQRDIYRVFQYHGAEHKTIFCYEAGLPLTVENVRGQTRHHPRCGTSFLFVVIFVSILLSSVIFGIWPIKNALLRTLVHLLLLPLVVGITYEFNRWVGRHVQENKLAQLLTKPGMWMQNFTTNEPDDSMIEVAIRAMELVLPSEKGKDEW